MVLEVNFNSPQFDNAIVLGGMDWKNKYYTYSMMWIYSSFKASMREQLTLHVPRPQVKKRTET